LEIFEEEETLLAALQKIKENNIEISEVYTPYPIHKVFKIMGRKTKLPLATFIYAFFGLTITYLFLYYTSVISYPLIYGGKPSHSIPSFILICFIATIFFSVLLTVITFFVRSRLYPGKKVTIVDERITDNGFVVLIKSKAGMSENDIKNIQALLEDNDATDIILQSGNETVEMDVKKI